MRGILHAIGEGEVAVFSARRWDRRNRADLVKSTTPCHGAQVGRSYWALSPLRLTVLASKPEDYNTAPEHLQSLVRNKFGEKQVKIDLLECYVAGRG